MNQPESPPQPWIARSAALYQRLLVCYPIAFRRAYGAQLVQTFRDTCRQASQEHGLRGLLGCWMSLLTDLAGNALAERLMEGLTMSRRTLRRLAGLLTLVSVVGLIVLSFSIGMSFFTPGPVFAVFTKNNPSGSGSFYPFSGNPEGTLYGFMLYQSWPLAAHLLVACCFVFVLLGVTLAQRTWLGRLSGSLAMLGQVGMTLFLVLLLLTFSGRDLLFNPPAISDVKTLWLWGVLLPFAASVALSIGLVVCGIVSWKERSLPGWKGLPLLLGLWLGVGNLGLWWLQWTNPMLFLAGTAFIGETSGLASWITWGFTLYALISYGLWGWLGFTLLVQKPPREAQIQAALG
jgi:hypothetical protein